MIFSRAGAQLRVARPAARPARFGSVIRASEGQKGAKNQGSESTMGVNVQAQQDVEQMSAPEGDRALSGMYPFPGSTVLRSDASLTNGIIRTLHCHSRWADWKCGLRMQQRGAAGYDPPHPEGVKGNNWFSTLFLMFAGEKAQRGGESTAGAKDYDPPHPEGAKGASATTPEGEESKSGVAQDGKTDAQKGTF